MVPLMYLAGLLALLLCSAFFAGAEVAIVGIPYARAHRLAKENVWGAKSLCKLKKDLRRAIITILIGNNIVNIALTSLSTAVAVELLGSIGVGVSIGVIFFLILSFGDVFPKTLSSMHTERAATFAAPFIEVLSVAFTPMIVVMKMLTDTLLRSRGKHAATIISKREVQEVMELGRDEKVLEDGEVTMMKRVLQFNEIPVKNIITPIDSVVTVGADELVEDVIKHVSSHDYTRYPVTNRYGRIIGSLKVKSLFRHAYDGRKTKVSQLVEEPLFMDEEAKIDDAFSIMKLRHRHIAYAVNEAGKVTGIITTEDVIEELVGEF